MIFMFVHSNSFGYVRIDKYFGSLLFFRVLNKFSPLQFGFRPIHTSIHMSCLYWSSNHGILSRRFALVILLSSRAGTGFSSHTERKRFGASNVKAKKAHFSFMNFSIHASTSTGAHKQLLN